MEDGVDCERCGKRRYSFWDDPVGDLLTFPFEPRPWANKIVAIVHNAKAFDLHFILNRAIMLKWKPGLITNGLKNHKYQNGASSIFGQRVLSPMCTA